MKRIIYFALLMSVPFFSTAQNGEWMWAKDFFNGLSFVSGANGAGFLVAGSYNPGTPWNNPPLTPYNQTNSAYFIRYDGFGDWLWFQDFGFDYTGSFASAMPCNTTPTGNI